MLPVSLVGDDDGDRHLGAELGGARGAERFQRLLQAPVDRQFDTARVGMRARRLPRRDGRPAWGSRAAPSGSARACAAVRLLGSHAALADHAVEHRVAAGEGSRRIDGPAVAPRAIAAGPPAAPTPRWSGAPAPCRNRRGWRHGCPRYCRHRAPASGRAIEDLVLAELVFERVGMHHLPHLAREVAGGLALDAAAPPAW